jgi:hypothetical protein
MDKKLKFVKGRKAAVRMHPALDVVDGVLYVTVQAEIEDDEGHFHTTHVVLTSSGEVIAQDDWRVEATKRGLHPYVECVDLGRTGMRWTNESLEAFQDGTLEAPTWKAAYDAIYRALDERIIVREPDDLMVLTLYIMATYFYVLFDSFPLLHLLGPSESGKSRAADAVAKVGFNGINQGDATPAVIFRFANTGCFTQVLKECDHLSKLDSDDRFVRQLQSGFSKSEALVDLTEAQQNKKHLPTTYYAYSPRTLCSTKPLKAFTLKNRCIRRDFIRTPNADQDKLDRTMNDEAVWEPLRDSLYRLQLLKWQDVAAAREAVLREWRGEGAPKGRARDKWIPLAAMAACVGDAELTQRVKLCAFKDMQMQQQDAANDFTGMLMRFAADFVVMRYGKPLEVTRAELWKEFSGGHKDTSGKLGYSEVSPPAWLKRTGVTVTVEQLERWIKGPKKLLEELQRLKLVGEVKAKAANNYYPIDRDNVLATAHDYLGENVFDEGEDKPQRPTPQAACPKRPKGGLYICSGCGQHFLALYFKHCQDDEWRCPECFKKDAATVCTTCQGRGSANGPDARLKAATFDDELTVDEFMSGSLEV